MKLSRTKLQLLARRLSNSIYSSKVLISGDFSSSGDISHKSTLFILCHIPLKALGEFSHSIFMTLFFFLQLLEFLKRILVVHYLLTPWNGFLMGKILHLGLFGIKSFLISLNHNSQSTFKEMTYTASDGNLKLYVCEINLSHKKLYGNF